MKRVPLTNSSLVCVVDDEDYDLVAGRSWRLHNGYATTNNPRRDEPRLHSVLMHRLLLRAAKSVRVSHLNGDRLDNRRSNLLLIVRAA